MIVTIEQLRRQLRLGEKNSAFDADLTHLARVGEAWALRTTRRTLLELMEMGGGIIPPEVVNAVLTYCAYLFKHPEGETTETLSPFNAYTQLKPFIKL